MRRLARWWPLALALLTAAGFALAQRPRGGLSSINGQSVTPSDVDVSGSLKANSLQTHSGGAQAMSIATTGTGNVTIGNSTSGSLLFTGSVPVMQTTGFQNNGYLSTGAGSSCFTTIAGAASANPVTVTNTGTNCGITIAGTGTGANTFGAAGSGVTTIGNATGNVTSAGTWNSSAASGPQFACTGAAGCSISSASGQTMLVDTGGGTATACIGCSTATTTTVGRVGQTTNLNGNATFNTAGPNLGSTVTGFASVYAAGLLTATTNYGAFNLSQSANNVKFRQVTCTHAVAGTSTAATLAIRNVTDSTTLCSGSYTCTTTANTPTAIFDCNQTPVAGKNYALQFTTGCGGTQVSGLNCNIEVAH